MRSRSERELILVLFAALLLASAGCGSAKGGAGTTETTSDEDELDDEESADPTPLDYYNHYMSQAGLAIAEGDKEGALDNYLEAAAVLDATDEVTVERAEAHFLAADMAYQRLEHEQAIAEYEKAIEIYLRFKGNSRAKAAVALNALGVIYREKAEKNKARNCWEQALQIYRELPAEFQKASHVETIKQNIRDLEYGN
ncbi:MAG: tetratricopeptide repeat protein [Deltaproteobacteria bacterium]|nr:tetratricopeptide repeat protein [Deltaproteobacteria bacterium]